ncbi:MAG TPA: hypothetical protein VE631_00315 [Alphaproteobacteria bacterium]|nr:hypothetical protein [Alphaproteobacteria bacterium]
MTVHEVASDLNTSWTILIAFLIYFMHGGFGFLEAGMCSDKNVVDALSHNLVILAVTIAVYWLVGFGLMFGNGNAFFGLTGFAPSLLPRDVSSFHSIADEAVPLVVVFAFVTSFSDTPATLIAGAGAERIRFSAVVVLSALISGLIYPVIGHWVLGGGWLANLSRPIFDTGAGMVHLAGGCCALAVALFLGPRGWRFRSDESRHALAVSSMPMVFLGAFILWLGFFAFNAGFAMYASRSVGLVVTNTALAGAFGTVVTLAGITVLTGNAQLRASIVGLLTANVAITSCSSIVAPWAAAAIGVLAGLATLASIRLWITLKIDDPTEYLTMNLTGGFLGILAVGVFADPEIFLEYSVSPLPRPGLLYGQVDQLLTQILGAVVIVAFSLGLCSVFCAALARANLLRVPPDEERSGSDVVTHGEKASGREDEREQEP